MDCFAFSRPGSALLSRVLRRSTIGAGVFHGRVRKGNGWGNPAMTTRSAKGKTMRRHGFHVLSCFGKPVLLGWSPRKGAKGRIRTRIPCFACIREAGFFDTSWAGRMAPRSEAPQGQRPSRLVARPVLSVAAKPRQRQDIRWLCSSKMSISNGNEEVRSSY